MVVSNFSENLRINPNSNMPMDNILRTVGEKGPKLWLLKLVSVTFYQTFNFSPNDSPSKTIKNVNNFFPSFPHFPDSKGQIEVE